MTCSHCRREVKATDLDYCRTCRAGICQRCRCLGNEMTMAIGRCPVCNKEDGMDEKQFDAMVDLWVESKSKLSFGKWMYYHGCTAQADADRVAVAKIKGWSTGADFMACSKDEVLSELAAARIVEGK